MFPMNAAPFPVKIHPNVVHFKNAHHLITALTKSIIFKRLVVYLKHQYLLEDVTFQEHLTEEHLISLEVTKLHQDKVIQYQVGKSNNDVTKPFGNN